MRHLTVFIVVIVIFSVFAMGNKTERNYHLQRMHSTDIDIYRRLSHLDSLIDLDKDTQDPFLLLKIDMAFQIGDYRRVCQAWNCLSKTFKDKMPLHDYCRISLRHMTALARLQDIEECLSAGRRLLNLHKPDSLLYYDALAYKTIHGLFIGSQPISDDYLDRVSEIYKKSQTVRTSRYCVDRIKFSLYSIMLDRSLHDRQYDMSLTYIDTLSQIALYDMERHSLLTNKALVYMLIGKSAEAEEIYKEILNSPIENLDKGITLINYTHLLNQQGKFVETLDVLNSNKKAATALYADIYQSYLMGNQAIAEYNTGNFDYAFNLLLDSHVLRDSLEYNTSVVSGVAQLENERLRMDNEKLTGKRDILTAWLAVVLLLVVMAFSMGIFLILRIRMLRKKEGEMNHKYMALEFRYAELQNNVNETAKMKDGKLSANMIKVAELEETISSIEQIMRAKTKTPSDMIASIRNILKVQSGREDSRELFERQFEQAHNGFLNKLHEYHPDLTQGESRMCAYIIMNLSTKEIASVINKSIRSVESSRYRIGKKLGVPDGKSLLSYLRQFC